MVNSLSRGPGFSIYMNNDIKINNNKCPGVVVNGRDTLVRLIELFQTSKGKPQVPLVESYVLSKAEAAAFREEL